LFLQAARCCREGRLKQTALSYQRDKQRAGVIISTLGLLFQGPTEWQSIPSAAMATNNTDLEELKKNVDHVFIMTNAIIVCCKFVSFIPYFARLYFQLHLTAVSGFASLFDIFYEFLK